MKHPFPRYYCNFSLQKYIKQCAFNFVLRISLRVVNRGVFPCNSYWKYEMNSLKMHTRNGDAREQWHGVPRHHNRCRESDYNDNNKHRNNHSGDRCRLLLAVRNGAADTPCHRWRALPRHRRIALSSSSSSGYLYLKLPLSRTKAMAGTCRSGRRPCRCGGGGASRTRRAWGSSTGRCPL